jgi:hypothetical protein
MRQQTLAKMTRERLVRERSERKLEKKYAAAADCEARADESTPAALEDSAALDES